MPKLQQKATTITKTKTKVTALTKKKGHTKNQKPKSSHKRKPEDDLTGEESSNTEPPHPPPKKYAKQLVDIVANIDHEESEVAIDVQSISDIDNSPSSDNEVWSQPSSRTQVNSELRLMD